MQIGGAVVTLSPSVIAIWDQFSRQMPARPLTFVEGLRKLLQYYFWLFTVRPVDHLSLATRQRLYSACVLTGLLYGAEYDSGLERKFMM